MVRFDMPVQIITVIKQHYRLPKIDKKILKQNYQKDI